MRLGALVQGLLCSGSQIVAGIGPNGAVKQPKGGQAFLSSRSPRSLCMAFPYSDGTVSLLRWQLKPSSTGILLNKMEIVSSLMI